MNTQCLGLECPCWEGKNDWIGGSSEDHQQQNCQLGLWRRPQALKDATPFTSVMVYLKGMYNIKILKEKMLTMPSMTQ